MTKREKDPDREERIQNEIIADAHDEEEQVMGWCSYLEEKLRFPFQAVCIAQRSISPLAKGEQVTVTGMSSESESLREMFVEIRWQGRDLAMPLAQLKGLKVDAETREAIADWHYWIGMGYEF